MNILIGPGWKFYQYHGNHLKRLSGEQYSIPFSFEDGDFHQLLQLLPSDFEPDILLYETPEYISFPLRIENAPFPTVAMVGDWNIGFTAIKDNLSRFDWIVTDKVGVKIFQEYGYENIDYWSMFAFDPQTHYLMDGFERTYDVLIIGNFNHEFQRERAKWLKRLSLLHPRYKIGLLANIFGEDYPKLLNQAKIVFNRSIRKEMNKRAYEAPANGALLFFEEENLEIREYLQPGKECVLYNDQNFESLVEYYLQHDEEREKIARAGHRKIQQYTYERQLERLLQLLQQRQVIAKRERRRRYHSLSESMRYYQDAKIAVQEISLKRLQIAQQNLEKAVALNPRNYEARNGLAFVYLLIMEQKAADEKQSRLYFDKSINSFIDLAEEVPNAGLVHYNIGFICQTIYRYDLAEAEYQKAIKTTLNDQPLVVKDFYFPRDYITFRIEWEKIASRLNGDPEKQEAENKKLLRWRCNMMLGELYQQIRRTVEAIQSYQQAIITRPDLGARAHLKLADIYSSLGQYEDALQEYVEAIELEPFTKEAWKGRIELLHRLGRYEEAVQYCEEIFWLIDCAPFYKNELLWLIPLCKEAQEKLAGK